MHIRNIYLRIYRRFHELRIDGLPERAKLVVLAGPNGGGKSSVFDALLTWHSQHGGPGAYDVIYHHKAGLPPDPNWGDKVQVDFWEALPTESIQRRKMLYVRSGYRNEADFTVSGFQRLGPVHEAPRVARLIDNDVSVSQNYQRLVSTTIASLYGGHYDDSSGREIREQLIGKIRESMQRVFEGLVLSGPGDPLDQGSFYFEKGTSRNFHYKNLSAGEKAAFDLLLDLHIKLASYDDTVFCIDEPELHMHARLQAQLLDEIYRLLPASCQLWIATHSIGMLRKARDLWQTHPDEVVFLDFHDQDFDAPVHLTPAPVTRKLWLRHLGTAVDDLAHLVAPAHVVLCEGGSSPGARSDFDARCYRSIFEAEYPDTEFVPVGNDNEVVGDRRWLGKALQLLVSGTRVTRLVDRDQMSSQEVADLTAQGVRVLGRRHLEAYLLDDAVLTKLCEVRGRPELVADALAAKQAAMTDAQGRGADPDDIKSAAGELYVQLRRLLGLSQAGNTAETFMRDSLAPLLPEIAGLYRELRRDVFGDGTIH